MQPAVPDQRGGTLGHVLWGLPNFTGQAREKLGTECRKAFLTISHRMCSGAFGKLCIFRLYIGKRALARG